MNLGFLFNPHIVIIRSPISADIYIKSSFASMRIALTRRLTKGNIGHMPSAEVPAQLWRNAQIMAKAVSRIGQTPITIDLHLEAVVVREMDRLCNITRPPVRAVERRRGIERVKKSPGTIRVAPRS